MSDTPQALVIGGPIDGQLRNVTSPHLLAPRVLVSPLPDMDASPFIKNTIYELEIFRAADSDGTIKEFPFYHLPNVTPASILQALVTSYNIYHQNKEHEMRTTFNIEIKCDLREGDDVARAAFKELLRDNAETLYAQCSMVSKYPPTIMASQTDEVEGKVYIDLFPDAIHVEDYSAE